MRTLGLNFVSRRRHLSPVAAASVLAGLVVLGSIGMDYLDTRETLVRAEASLERLQRGQRTGTAARATGVDVSRVQPSEALEADRVMAQLQLPWGKLLDVLETETTPAIELLSLDAQGSARTLQLVGEAPGMGDVLAYVRRLRGAALLDEVVLSGHEGRTAGAAPSVRFTLDIRWGMQR